MSYPVATRVIEICPKEWVVQFEGGLNSWVQLGNTFPTQSEAEAFEAEQINDANFSA
jgi:hypothetical protein